MTLKYSTFLAFILIASQCNAQTPSAPELSVSVDASFVTIQWSEVSGASGYTLFYADYPEATTLGSLDMMSSLKISAEIPAGSAFYIAVQAYNNEGVSPYSNIESFALEALPAPSPSPTPTSTAEQVCSQDSEDARYAWPMAGENGKAWVINNYVDLLPGLGTQDYASAPGVSGKTYDGHNGIDIDIPSFREMDAGVAVYAIQDGRVSSVIDTNSDRSTFCASTPWNVVVVEQLDGNRVYYGHLKTGSATVSIGQMVAKGELLGQIGSSGCSTQPHLHLELRGSNDSVVDPFRDNLWCDAPEYERPVSVMTGFLLEGPASLHSQPFKDPPADLEKIQLGTKLLPILHSANGAVGDSIGLRVTDPSGKVRLESKLNFSASLRHSNWYWNPAAVDEVGNWTIEYQANEETQYQIEVEVE